MPCNVTLSALDSIYLETKLPVVRQVEHLIEDGWLSINTSYYDRPYYDECYRFQMEKSVTDKWGTKIFSYDPLTYSYNEEVEYFIPSAEDSNFYYDPQQINTYGIFNSLFDVDTAALRAASAIGLIPPVYISGSKILIVQDTIEAGKAKRMEMEIDLEHRSIETRVFEDSVHILTDRMEYKRYVEWIIPKKGERIYYSELPSGIRYQITETETYSDYTINWEYRDGFYWDNSNYDRDECAWEVHVHLYMEPSLFAENYDYGIIGKKLTIWNGMLCYSGLANNWFDQHLYRGYRTLVFYDTEDKAMMKYISNRNGDAVAIDCLEDMIEVQTTFYMILPCNLTESAEVYLFRNLEGMHPIEIYGSPLETGHGSIELHLDGDELPYLGKLPRKSFEEEDEASDFTAQEEIQKETKIKVYPNPAKEQVTLVLPSYMNKEGEVKILNTLGVAVLSQQYAQGGQITLDIQSLPSGFYVIRCTNDKNVVSTYFVKQ